MDIQTIYYLAGTIVSLLTIAGAILAISRWWRNKSTVHAGSEEKSEEEEVDQEAEEQIACDNCKRVFTPKWKRRSGILSNEEYAVCPYCGEESVFEEEDEEIEEETEEDTEE